MNLQIITAPLIGGLIGLITNSLAIRMLFRPYREIRICGIRIPFTPGLIPKEKARIAHAIAQVISGYILDQETILNALASRQIQNAYETIYDEKMNTWKTLHMTIDEVLQKYHLEDSASTLKTKISDSVSNYIIEKCIEEDIIRKLISDSFSDFKENMNPFMYKMGRKALELMQETLIMKAEEMVKADASEYIHQCSDQIYEEYMGTPVSEVVILLEEKFPNLKMQIWERYTEFIQNKFGQFLSTLDIRQIIEDKINDYDLKELENMILEISGKELKALVWLGGLLGILMGFINLLF